MANGRFAPSPTGPLHLGNLRTALLAWLFARSSGGAFLVRMEDLDRVQASVVHEAGQLRDLAALGLDWDGDVVRQSERFDRYEAAISRLTAGGLTYACFCSRREIREAASAPHDDTVVGIDIGIGTGATVASAERAYPGTCRDLSRAEVARRHADGRPAALRLRGPGIHATVEDLVLGPITALVDDVVLRRNDGVPAYNLAVVVDDAAQGVEQVVRGDDLASSAPRQRHLAALLGLPSVTYAHVPLVLGPTGRRLAKRDGAVTLDDQLQMGHAAADVLAVLAISLGLAEEGESVSVEGLLARFDPTALPRHAWWWTPERGAVGDVADEHAE